MLKKLKKNLEKLQQQFSGINILIQLGVHVKTDEYYVFKIRSFLFIFTHFNTYG